MQVRTDDEMERQRAAVDELVRGCEGTLFVRGQHRSVELSERSRARETGKRQPEVG